MLPHAPGSFEAAVPARLQGMALKVRKAVFPAAGLGTRFLPASKSIPKEMLPLVDTPLIQSAVEECSAAGISHVIIVTSRGKSTIEDHFDISVELEQALKSRGKTELLEAVERIPKLAEISYTRQQRPLGLGHAVLVAKDLVGAEPFVVVLSDDVIHAERPCTSQLIDAYQRTGGSVIALMEVPRERISAYGVVDAEPVEVGGVPRGRLFRIRSMVEKPKPADAPSNLAIIGRYVLTPEIFSSIEATGAGALGEIQLTDGIKHLAQRQPVFGYKFEGTRYDAGDKFGFLQATVEFAMRRDDEVGAKFREYLKGLKLAP